ncbi:hypothetical protein [Microbulbifer yueqingensis]|uniref:Lipoprotein n=1 Tax=Microbulbifer yueqingensis TaxID=658219 RepID=A0A1G9BLK7_9GAMM|nr:hypothetical protein [Microbulbifer yueqingensis]SDK40357.1 hypothetical protein SAMN05216212_2290 [Microbulbifer yueqingensis]
MKIRNAYKFLFTIPLLFGFATTGHAQGGWFGGDDEYRPSLLLQPSEITFAGPTPMDGQNLQLLLSLPNGLGELQRQASAQFEAHLQNEIQAHLTELFNDEEIPLVENSGELVLDSAVEISIRQQIREVKKFDRYDSERGSLKVYGKFRYTLRDRQGAMLDQQQVDLEKLGVERRYLTRTPRDGGMVEDSTGPAVEKVLSDLVDEIIDVVEDRLEAGKLQQLALKTQSP